MAPFDSAWKESPATALPSSSVPIIGAIDLCSSQEQEGPCPSSLPPTLREGDPDPTEVPLTIDDLDFIEAASEAICHKRTADDQEVVSESEHGPKDVHASMFDGTQRDLSPETLEADLKNALQADEAITQKDDDSKYVKSLAEAKKSGTFGLRGTYLGKKWATAKERDSQLCEEYNKVKGQDKSGICMA